MRKPRTVPAHLAAALSLILSAAPATALDGGTPVAPDAAPFLVRIEAQVPGARRTCTGVLVAPDVALTAGHCLDRASAVSVVPARGQGSAITARAFAAHPLWSGGLPRDGWDRRVLSEGGARYVDLALVVLSGPLPGGRPLNVHRDRGVLPGEVVTYGLARDAALAAADGFATAPARIVGRFREAPHLLRLSGEALAWCPGDSGAPVTTAGEEPRLIALVGLGSMAIPLEGRVRTAAAPRCGRLATAVLIAPHLPWIEAELARLAPGRRTTLAGLRR